MAAWRRLRKSTTKSLRDEQWGCSPHESQTRSLKLDIRQRAEGPERPRPVVLPAQPVLSDALLVSPIQWGKLGSEKGYLGVLSQDRNPIHAAWRKKMCEGRNICYNVSQGLANCPGDSTPTAIVINKVLLAHGPTHSFTITAASAPTETTQPLTEKACNLPRPRRLGDGLQASLGWGPRGLSLPISALLLPPAAGTWVWGGPAPPSSCPT